MASNIEVIIGTYEEYLVGYKVETDGENASLHQSFAVHAHTASVRSVHTKGRYLASGGADDRIYIYDMRSRQEIQMINQHSGIINHVQFTPDHSHLLSASADGSLAATRTGSWILEGSWKAPHGGKPITYISIHPSGKLALTLGADLTLKTWNLLKGRQIFTTNLKSRPSLSRIVDVVEWGPTGQFFTLTGAKTIEIWDIDSAGVVKEIPCDSRPTCVCWLNDEIQLVGLTNGKILMFSLHDDEPTVFQMYEGTRVKALAFHQGHLASISSSGELTIWTVNIEEKQIDELCSTNLGCRPICLTILDLSQFAKDYELKMENVDEEEAIDVATVVKPAKKNKSYGARVVVEIENGENASSTVKNKQRNGNQSQTVQTTLKRKIPKHNKSATFTEEDVGETLSKGTVSGKNNKRKSGFIEEDFNPATEETKKTTNKKWNSTSKKPKNNLNQTFSEFSSSKASSSNGKPARKGRLSIA